MFVSETDIGRKLLDIRRRAVVKRLELLSEDEVLDELRRRREVFSQVQTSALCNEKQNDETRTAAPHT